MTVRLETLMADDLGADGARDSAAGVEAAFDAARPAVDTV
jgi:hypothetical protein